MLAVARGAAVGGHHPVERPVPAAEPRQPDPHHHARLPSRLLLLLRRRRRRLGSRRVDSGGSKGVGVGFWGNPTKKEEKKLSGLYLCDGPDGP